MTGRLDDADPTDVVIDGGDLGCGELLLLASRRVRGLPAGTVVRLTTTDAGAPIEIPTWCRLVGHHYIGPAAVAGSGPEPTTSRAFRFRTRG